MEKIGDKELFYRGTFLVPEREGVSFDANAAGWIVKVQILFKDEGGEQSIKVEGMDAGARITFINWKSSLGTATITPARIGKHSSGRNLYFMASNFRIGETNKLDIQLLMGDSK